MPFDENIEPDAVLGILQEADQRLIDEHHWLRGGYCLLDAIDYQRRGDTHDKACLYLAEALPRDAVRCIADDGTPDHEESVISFNDHKTTVFKRPATTFKMVKGVLKRAIEARKADL